MTAAFMAVASEAATGLNHKQSPETKEAIDYLSKSKDFRSMYRQFGKSGATILLTDGVSSFDENANIVYWNPSDGNQVEAGIQSSALGLAHEIGHAVRFSRIRQLIEMKPFGHTTLRLASSVSLRRK